MSGAPIISLVDAYSVLQSPVILFDLLAERERWQSISHRGLPTAAEHMAFFISRSYEAWYLIKHGKEWVGACYITKQREVGIFIFRVHRGKGMGLAAVKKLMELHPGKFLANISPKNEPSIAMFRKLGFRHIQNTYAL